MTPQPGKPLNPEEAAAKLAPLLKAGMQELSTPLFLDRINIIAMDRMVKYRAHIKAGFTEAQALERCTK